MVADFETLILHILDCFSFHNICSVPKPTHPSNLAVYPDSMEELCKRNLEIKTKIIGKKMMPKKERKKKNLPLSEPGADVEAAAIDRDRLPAADATHGERTEQ